MRGRDYLAFRNAETQSSEPSGDAEDWFQREKGSTDVIGTCPDNPVGGRISGSTFPMSNGLREGL